MQSVEKMSSGRASLDPGPLYGGLKSMIKKKWIEEIDGDNSRRRCYRLTEAGKTRLKAEIDRLEELTNLGNAASPLLGKGSD